MQNKIINPVEAIKKRYSCRSYIPKPIEISIKNQLSDFIDTIDNGPLNEKINFQLIEKDTKSKNLLKLNYGLIINHFNYILGISKRNRLSRMNYGYLLEEIVLKVTELNLATCWIGYFDPSYFTEFTISDGYEIPGIIIIGYPTEKPSLGQQITRFSINSSKRNEWKELFFLDNFTTPLPEYQAGGYKQALEMLRLAPSSGNTQPWRIIFDNKQHAFHFFKKVISQRYEEKGLHDIDIGIAMSHFEIIANYNSLKGKWHINDEKEMLLSSENEYFISWVIDDVLS